MTDQAIQPPCAGKWWLFDSTDITDHKDAAALCDACPMFDACERLLAEELTHKYSGGGPRGTWAGRLIRPKGHDIDARRPPINPDVEDAMFTDDEARAAQSAYMRGERTDRTIVGTRVYKRRCDDAGRKVPATAMVAPALQMRARGFTTREAASELGTTLGALQKAIERSGNAERRAS